MLGFLKENYILEEAKYYIICQGPLKKLLYFFKAKVQIFINGQIPYLFLYVLENIYEKGVVPGALSSECFFNP